MSFQQQMIRTWSFYRDTDGTFLGREYSAPSDQFLAQNTPRGSAPMEGRFDRERQRVDLQTRRVIDDPEFARVNAEKRVQAMRGDLAMARVDQLERQQARALREAALNRPGAIERLEAIDVEIAKLRALAGG